MTERILTVSGLNGTELIRSAALRGSGSMGTRVMNSAELAQHALTRSGRVMAGSMIASNEIASMIFSFISDIPYFSGGSFGDALKLYETIMQLRRFITEPDEDTAMEACLAGGIFARKNAALLEVYRRYRAHCREKGLFDAVDVIKTAVEFCEPFDAEFILLETCPLMPLEAALVDKLSRGTARVCTFEQFYGAEAAESTDYEAITAAYGAENEAAHVIAHIRDNGIPADDCTIAIAKNGDYVQPLQSLAQLCGIPITLGCGIPVKDTNPGRLLILWDRWMTTGQYGKDALRAILTSPALDRKHLWEDKDIPSDTYVEAVVQTAGGLRLGFNADANRRYIAAYRNTIAKGCDAEITLNAVESLFRAFERGCADFIIRYSHYRFGEPGIADHSAANAIGVFMRAYREYAGRSETEMIPYTLEQRCCREASREGCLHVVSLDSACAVMRGHLYIMGLSANDFPGKPTENDLMSDDDYLSFTSNDPQAPTSTLKLEQRTKRLKATLRVAKALGVKVQLSYCAYDTSDLKEQNPSSVLFDLFYEKTGIQDFDRFKESLNKTGYFDHAYSPTARIGAIYADGEKEIIADSYEQREPVRLGIIPSEKGYSPSAINTFVECPRRFYLQSILNIRPDEPDDPHEIISAADMGTLVHTCMEHMSEFTGEDDVRAYASNLFDNFIAGRRPIVEKLTEIKRQEAVDLALMGYREDPGNTVEYSERPFESVETPEGVTLCGRTDRIERDPDGKYVIVDYKTSKQISADPNDISTCLQAMLYAYMLKLTDDLEVDRVEYRYLRSGITVRCPVSDASREAVKESLRDFKNAMDSGNFERKEGDACKWCQLSNICRKGDSDEYRI